MRARGRLLVLSACAVAAAASAAPSRIVSLDQCADQYVLALAPRADIVALSTRAANPDSWLRGRAAGLPRRRADAEAVLLARPDLVVRSWAGDPALLARLASGRVRVLTLEDAGDFAGVRRNVLAASLAMDQRRAGERLLDEMDADLHAARGAWRGRGAVYLTDGGASAGPGVLVDAILRAAGLTNLDRRPGWGLVPRERLALEPPAAVVRGVFLAPGRRAPTPAPRAPTLLRLPGALLGCPAWFAALAARRIAASAPERGA